MEISRPPLPLVEAGQGAVVGIQLEVGKSGAGHNVHLDTASRKQKIAGGTQQLVVDMPVYGAGFKTFHPGDMHITIAVHIYLVSAGAVVLDVVPGGAHHPGLPHRVGVVSGTAGGGETVRRGKLAVRTYHRLVGNRLDAGIVSQRLNRRHRNYYDGDAENNASLVHNEPP